MSDVNNLGGFNGMADPSPKRGGRRSKQKGDRFERELVNRFLLHGVSAERVPLSGAAGGSYANDITFVVKNQDWRGECKSRGTGFVQLYRWIEPVHALFIKSDRQPTLVCVRLDDFIEIIGGKK